MNVSLSKVAWCNLTILNDLFVKLGYKCSQG